MVGLLLPLLPTTPFLLLALWAGARGDPRLRFRLYRHRRFGPPLRDWRRHPALSMPTKISACAVIGISAGLVWLTAPGRPIALAVSTLLLAVAAYLLSRPGRPGQRGNHRSSWQPTP